MASASEASPASNRPALTGHIVFIPAHGTYGDETILTANADGAGERQLTEPNVRCCPRLLRDGTQVRTMDPASPNFATGGGAIIGIDGSGVTLLPLRDRTLNYIAQARSSDGRIGFGGWDPAHADRHGIYTARVDGEDVVRVTQVAATHDVPTDFSPDSARLVFFPEVVTGPEPWDLGGSLWLVNVDGTGARRIQTAGITPGPWARWSPDGTTIVFATAHKQQSGTCGP